MIRNLVNAALCLIFMASAVAQQIAGSTRNTAPETFFRYPAAFEVQLSPSGDRIAITTRRGDSRSGLVVLDLEPKGTPRWVASFNDADVVHFHWLGDDELVFSVVDLNAGSAADYEIASGLYSVHADGSGLRQLVRRHGSPFVTNGDDHKQGLDWNHIFLGTIMGHPDEIIVGRIHASGREVDEVTPFLLNVHNGRTRPLDLMSPPAHVLHWYFDESGIPYSAQTHDDGRDRLYWLDREKHVWNILADDPVGKQVITPVGLDSKGALLVSAPRVDGLWGTLLRLDLSSSPPTERELIAAPGFDIRPRPVFGGSGHQLLGVRIETDARSTVWYDPTMKALQQRVDELLPGTVNQLECRHCLAANSVVLVRSSSGSDPGRIWLFHGDKQGAHALEPVMSLMPDIEPASMGTKELVRIKARDGLEIPVWVTYPHGYKHGERGTNGPALPAVVLVHGGPWVRGVQWTWNPMSQFLAANGYLVIEPEYRGSDGYGARFMEAGFKQFGRSMQDDVTDSLRWAQKTGIASDRACIMGASYGGYAVLMGLAKDPELYRCGVEWVGLADLDLFLKGSWWVLDDYSSENRTVYLPERVGRLPEDEAIIEANNPVKLASRIRAPLLMAYGSGDKRVPMAHGERMLEALKSNGQNPEWIVYEGEGHGWRTQEHQIDFARRVQTFLAANLSPD